MLEEKEIISYWYVCFQYLRPNEKHGWGSIQCGSDTLEFIPEEFKEDYEKECPEDGNIVIINWKQISKEAYEYNKPKES